MYFCDWSYLLLITLARIVWGITGSGDHIQAIIETMKQLEKDPDHRLTVIVSKAGEQMLRWYGLWNDLNESFRKVMKESNSNVPFIAGPLQLGKYDVLVVAPLTANSTAKIAHGIADTLVTNAVSQTLKGDTPVLLYPVDQFDDEIEALGPKGEKFTIRPRNVDLENVQRLRGMERVIILKSHLEILSKIESILKSK